MDGFVPGFFVGKLDGCDEGWDDGWYVGKADVQTTYTMSNVSPSPIVQSIRLDL